MIGRSDALPATVVGVAVSDRTDDDLVAYARASIENPFGRDLASARERNRWMLERFPEESVFRIDHFLGKEQVLAALDRGCGFATGVGCTCRECAVGRLVDSILGLSGIAAYAMVGVLAFGEAAVFAGLVLPGELAVLLGGVIAAAGHVSLWVMLVVASTAAVAGDSVGYEVGRHYGARLLAWEPLARRVGDRVEGIQERMRVRGGRMVFLGRWTAALRALVPGLAGMSGMPYRRFLAFNVTGGVAWACTFVLLGYVAGASWRSVEHVAGRASLLLLVLLVLVLALRWAVRWVAGHADEVRRTGARVLGWPPVAWVSRRYASQLSWLQARLRPGTVRGLGWTLSLAAVGATAWAFGAVVQDLLAGEELALADGPTARWVAGHTTPAASHVASVFLAVFAPPWGFWLVVAAALAAWWLRGRAEAINVAAAVTLATLLALVLRQVLPETQVGTRFPGAGVALTTAVTVGLVTAAAHRGWRAAVRVLGAGVTVVLLTGMAELVVARTALSGVVAGAALGALLPLLIEFTNRTLTGHGDLVPADADADEPTRAV